MLELGSHASLCSHHSLWFSVFSFSGPFWTFTISQTAGSFAFHWKIPQNHLPLPLEENSFMIIRLQTCKNIALTVSVFHNIVTPCFSTRILRRVVWRYQFVDELHPDPWLWHWGTKTLKYQDTAHCPFHFWSVRSLLTHVAVKTFEDRSISGFPNPFPLLLLDHLSSPVPNSHTCCPRKEKH